MNTKNSSFNTTEAGPSTIPTSVGLNTEVNDQLRKDGIDQNYSMKISAVTTSKAKILCRNVKDFVVGHKFEVKITISKTNEHFTVREIQIRIHWPNGQIVVKPIDVEGLQYKNEKSILFDDQCLCRGFALFTVEGKTSDGKVISFLRNDGTQIKPNVSFHSLLAKEAQEFYARYALYLSVTSLSFLVIDRILWWALRP